MTRQTAKRDSAGYDWLGKTLLHACAENWDRSVAAVLLDAGADLNARDLEFKGTNGYC